MKLSVVTTTYNSSTNISEFCQRICQQVDAITLDYEIIIVDDGSIDDSVAKLLSLKKQYNKIKVIELSRNFGHHQAGIVGLKESRGEFIFLIDSDLEELPELFNQFWECLHDNAELFSVYGVQNNRNQGFFQNLFADVFYKVFNYFSYIEIPKNMMTIRLMKRDYVNSLLQYPEKVIFLGGMMAHVGYKQKPLNIDKRYKGKTAYSFHRKLLLVVNSIISFSFKPIYIAFFSGLMIFLVSTVGLITYVASNDELEIKLTVLIMLALWIGSIVLSCTGLLGLYLSVIFQEVKQRPHAIIKKIY